MTQHFLIVLPIFYTILCMTDVHISTNGVAWMCNNEPEKTQIISSLSTSDENLIHKLEQVHAIHRHGSRVGSYPISTFLPNTNLKYNCNITSIVTKQYKQNNYYTDTLKQIFNIGKIYVENEQKEEGNCQYEQSLKHLIAQHKANAHHIKNAYIGPKSYHLFDNFLLTDISNNLRTHSTDNRIVLISTDYERTISSLSVIASQLFFTNISNDIIMNANVHDQGNDPYLWYEPCSNTDEYKQWNALFNAYQSKSIRNILNSRFANDTITSFEREGGIWFSKETGNQLLYPYCAGMKLPLTNDTFWNAVKLSYDMDTVKDYNLTQTQCVYKFINIPMLNKMYNYINQMKQYSYPRLLIYSVHDFTIIRLLQSLGMYDYNLIMFGELVTMEIYSAFNHTDSYYFRFTRKGNFVPYPMCNYYNGQTELCDLNVIINHSFKNVIMSTKEWLNKCNNLITNCECGFCDDNNNKNISTTIMYTTNHEIASNITGHNNDNNECPNASSNGNNIDAVNINFWIGIGIGIGIGLIMACCAIIFIRRCCCKSAQDKFLHNQYYLEEETYKL